MDDKSKTKQDLIKELQALRQRLHEMEASDKHHQQNDQALWKNEFFLKRSQEAGRIGSYIIDLYGDQENPQTWISTATMDDIFGIDETYSPRTGKTWLNLIVQREEVRQYFIQQVFNKRAPFEMEYQIIRPRDGRLRWILGRGELEFDKAGNPVRMIGTVQDITDRKQAEELLRTSEEKYRLLYSTMRDAFAHADLDGTLMEFNEAFAAMLGYPPEELKALTYRDITPEKWHAFEAGIIEKQVFQRGYSDIYEKEYLKKDGTVFPVELRTILLMDHAGKPSGMWAIIRDITKRKQAEKTIQNSEKKLQALMETTSAGIYIVQDTSFIYANAAYESITGYSLRELNELPFWSFIHPDFKELVKERGMKRLQGEILPSKYDIKIITKTGMEKWVELTSTIIDLSDKPTIMGSLFDISERKRIEAALRQSEERYRTILDDMEEGYLESDLFGNYTFANEASEIIFGYPRDEIVGMNYTKITADHENKEKMFYAYSRMFTSEIPIRNMEWKIIRKDGSLRTCEFNGFLLKNINGHTIGYRLLCRDVTVRRQAEEEREKIIIELQQALSEVKALSGLLPICSSCKKIRDDKGYWNQIEAYIAEHSEAQFSHGLCPECAKKLYPKYFK